MIVDLYTLVEKVTAASMILWGLALLLNPKILLSFYNTFTKKEENESLLYLTAGIFLSFGLAIIWIHNDWYLAPSIIVTMIGWILVLKAMFWISFPDFAIKIVKKFYKLISNKWFSYLYGLGLILVGFFILFAEKLFSQFLT